MIHLDGKCIFVALSVRTPVSVVLEPRPSEESLIHTVHFEKLDGCWEGEQGLTIAGMR